MNAQNRNGVAILMAIGVTAAVLPAFAQRAPIATPTGLSPAVLSLACSPTITYEAPPTPLRITGSQESIVHRTFAPGDLITINAGRENGMEVGQEFYARRALPVQNRRVARDNPATIVTTGWIRVYAVDDQMSLATITHACEALELNDYLEPFVLPTVPTISAEKPKPERDNYARLLAGQNNRNTFARGDYVVMDRGTDQGIEVGAQFVVYRDKLASGNFLFELGEAVAVSVRPDNATLQVTLSRDALRAGDYVALRKQTEDQ